MDFKFKLGSDISKLWFDYCLIDEKLEIIVKGNVSNSPEAIQEFINELLNLGIIKSISDILLVIEHTGLYINHLVKTWLSNGGRLSLIQASKISIALDGGNSFEEKTDPMDALRIAEYAVRFEDKLKLYELSPEALISLKLLRAQRKRVIKSINLLTVPLNEIKAFESKEQSDMLNELQHEVVQVAKTALKKINDKIKSIISNDINLQRLFKLISSVPGVGKVTAIEILITTNGFTSFSPNQAKSFARFCGVVPLHKSSGKFKRKPKTSKKANAKMKSLLTTGALSLLHTKSDLGRYYTRKKEQGKDHMTIINAMRNKIILRVFAVVKNQTMYKRNFDIYLQ